MNDDPIRLMHTGLWDPMLSSLRVESDGTSLRIGPARRIDLKAAATGGVVGLVGVFFAAGFGWLSLAHSQLLGAIGAMFVGALTVALGLLTVVWPLLFRHRPDLIVIDGETQTVRLANAEFPKRDVLHVLLLSARQGHAVDRRDVQEVQLQTESQRFLVMASSGGLTRYAKAIAKHLGVPCQRASLGFVRA